MRRSRIIYILTWVALGIILISALLLLAFSWNSLLQGPPSPFLVILCWIMVVAPGIFLFSLAVKKAHRLWVDEERSQLEEQVKVREERISRKESIIDPQDLDINGIARKLIRRIPDNASLEELGEDLLRNLAKELEIMSGLFYIRKKERFESVASYALESSGEPYSFKEGEGLTGQVARSQQIMVLNQLPEDYLEVYSGLGKSKPSYLAIIPFNLRNRTVAVLECSGYKYEAYDIERLFRIFSRDLVEKLSVKI